MKNKMRNQPRVFIAALILVMLFTQMAFALPAQVPASSAADPVELKAWYTYNWSIVNSIFSCRDSGTGCYVSLNYHAPGWMISQQSVYIDPGWKSPKLVYWTKYYSQKIKNFAYVDVQVEGQLSWDRIKTIGGTKFYWQQVEVDLSAYSGKTIVVKFQTEPNINDRGGRGGKSGGNLFYNRQLFYVQGVTINPE
jgi:hypothetical protein